MKKFARMIALTLICVLLLSLVSVAQADSCYELIKLLYQYEGEEAVVSLGEGVVFPAEPLEDNSVYFVVSLPDACVTVMGLNAQSEPEGCAWVDVQEMDGMMAFVQFCVSYQQLSENLDECENLIGGIIMMEGEDPYLIEDAENAEMFINVFSSLMAEE